MKSLLKAHALSEAIQKALKLSGTTMTSAASTQLNTFKTGGLMLPSSQLPSSQLPSSQSSKGKGIGKNRTKPSEVTTSRSSSAVPEKQEKKPSKGSTTSTAVKSVPEVEADEDPEDMEDLTGGNDAEEVEESEDDQVVVSTELSQEGEDWPETNPFEVSVMYM
jgi:hypothetical protein